MKKRNNFLALFVTLGFIYLLHTPFTVSSKELKVGIKPVGSKSVNLEDILNPGESKSVPYRLVNLSDSDLKIKLELAGIKDSYMDKVKYDLAKKYKILDYVKLQYNQVLLKKNEKTDVNLLLSIPKGSDPGEYLGGILVKDYSTREILGESKVNLLVNGELEKKLSADFSIVVKNNVPVAKIKLSNLGNTKIEGIRIDYVLKNLRFQKLVSSERSFLYTSPIVILPGDIEEIEHKINIPLDPLGTYEITASLNYGGLQPITFKNNFDYVSKNKLAVLGVVGSGVFVVFFTAFFFFVRWFARRRRQIKLINKKWNGIVSNLINGDYPKNPAGVPRIHEKDISTLVYVLRNEMRKTLRDEIKKLNYERSGGMYTRKVKKQRLAKVSSTSSKITSII